MKNLLVPVDFSDVTNRVIETAEEMARGFGARVWLMHCVNQFPSIAGMSEVPMSMPVTEAELPDHFSGEYRRLNELAGSLRSKGIDTEILFKSGSATIEILSAADQHHIDLIVIGSHGHGALYDLVVGSVTKSVLHRTHRPTLVVPSEARERVQAVASRQWEEPMATPY
jgi:nucleotide-binding universal stress UspA family protein